MTNEVRDSEADELIKDFLVRNYIHNAKVKEILEEYLEGKDTSNRPASKLEDQED
jgi:hypothetical protein